MVRQKDEKTRRRSFRTSGRKGTRKDRDAEYKGVWGTRACAGRARVAVELQLSTWSVLWPIRAMLRRMVMPPLLPDTYPTRCLTPAMCDDVCCSLSRQLLRGIPLLGFLSS